MTTDIQAAAAPPLSTAMRDGSRPEHEAAEQSGFMAELLNSKLSARAYTDLLLRLRRVYGALEQTCRSLADDPIVAAVHDPALDRSAAIDHDLAFWAPGEDPEMVDSPATDAYVARIHEASAWGGLVVAHHYTRYLGDLSGGQVIGRVLERTYPGVGGDTRVGIGFYHFAEIPKPKPYKDGYRARLDGLGLDAEQVTRVVDEVRVTFELNRAIFDELGERLADYRRD